VRKLVLITAAASTTLAGAGVAAWAGTTSSAPNRPAETVAAAAGSIAWSPCPDNDKWQGAALKGLECGTIKVPLDYAHPNGTKISVAVSRAKATDTKHYAGIILLNRGGPGGRGRDLPQRFINPANGLPKAVSARYDWIGFDPRGVQATDPSMICDPSYAWPGHARADYVPANKAQEEAWKRKAKKYAADCGRKYGKYLPFINTKSVARDMDSIRAALGQKKTSYFGYSYGTYLGQVYASMFPTHVRRIVIDSVVNAKRAWYDTQLDQNAAFEVRMKIFFRWIAKYDSVYHLGKTEKAVEKNYYKGRAKVKKAPLNGQLGPSEWDDFFVGTDGYRDYTWLAHAQELSDFVVKNDPKGLLSEFGPPDDAGQNGNAIYLATQCRDAAWPRNWAKWHKDYTRQYKQGLRSLTWNNAWFNAPCAYWPVKGGPAPKVGAGKKLSSMLILQATLDAATPRPGAFAAHKAFPTSRLVEELGGVNHTIAFTPNKNACINALTAKYLDTGALPKSKKGVDATCKASPLPDPTTQAVFAQPSRPRALA